MKTAAELGNKHECPNCGVKYYDLGKADPLCPKCGATVEGELPEGAAPEAGDSAESKTAKKKTAKKKTTKKKTKKKTTKG